ncbi:REP-associated tyrosine transposase [Butyrivibrio sp. AE2015]|uniref:REP-associated tyrosine transposase n=1 Tax=Butyrivibrio sp. AE2015 TaxID=1280663 RepID=UPI0003B44ED2|nr:transposase [Butyrivibrio sp. AE2015]
MPRKPRILSSTGIYHIILRSVNQHIIFEEDSDYQKFLFILSDCKKKYDIDIYAYCLMDNHIHLLIHLPDDKLSSFFQSLGSRFVRWYNNKYFRSGHLFQERFHSSAIENERAFLSALIYIHNNPVKANACRYASEYLWSSVRAFYGAKNSLVNVAYAYNIAGSKDSLLHYFAKETDSPENTLFKNDHLEITHFLTDEKALTIFKSVTHLPTASDVVTLEKSKRNEYVRALKKEHLTIKQIARIMDISETTVKRICKMAH